ncbi:hypothetical protein WQ54_05170 [Bacillus sp. SA1-12]|uniref:WXG100 family type VII secretion target n=1 Tax=Bacillus sp. SA1-12 TaxID=1455638 RepID=UPI0006260048|nr:glycine zipper domain-containing protein [Bacillus sp. SA1-12]KKI93231.1 hypothetical protein WQ54_05170 [Bacillus sp. SA1-12]
MGNKISVDPDRLEDLANDHVSKLSKIEEEYNDLHMELYNLISSAPAEYSHCFYQVGDPWGTGNQLVDLLSEMEIDLRMTVNKFSDADNLVGQLYKLHEKYGALTALGALVSKQLAFYGLGFTQFIKNSDDVYMYRHMNALNKLSDVVDNSKFRNVARAYLSPTNLLKKYRDVPFSDLVHKKLAKYLPGDVVKYTDSSKALFEGIKHRTLDSTTFKSFVKTGAKFAKTNVVSTLLVTGVMEAGGMGLKISENYAKYGNNPEVLKRENAKAVGNAVNNTVAISGGSIAGAFVGGALGSVVGPVGTVVGAAAGSFVGGLIGEQAAKLTAGIAEKAAIAFKEPIHAGVEFFKGGLEKAGKVVEGVNKGVDFVNDQIKETIADPVGKVKEIGSKAKETASSLVDGAKDFLEDKLSFF